MHEAPGRSTDIDDVARAVLAAFHSMPLTTPPELARDLTISQVRLLAVLRREGPQSMGAIADRFELSPTAVTGFVQRVERHGLVERRHRSDDRRVVECALSESGRGLIDALSGLRLDAIRRSLSVLAPADLATLHGLLAPLRDQREDVA
jgi:DNA-binding MarR family transcriptional regulator